jgi:probable F420-dependent oxidoreductase
MKVEVTLALDDFGTIGDQVRRAEALEFDGIVVPETQHNPFASMALAAEHSERLSIASSVAQAFVRSPTTTAYGAFDIQRFSEGRLLLGLGSQVKGQIERRFGMPWVAPGPRMRDYIHAMREVWSCWQEERPLDYEGTHYRLNVMTPNHRPQPLPVGIPFPDVYLAAVKPYMSRLAGEICQGVRLHSFATEAYIRAHVVPRLRQGLDRSGRSWADLDVSGGGMVVTAATEAEVAAAVERVRWSIAFYGSTRTYLSVWETHGWEETGQQLHTLSISNGWDQMPALITDEMVHTFAAVGTYEEIGQRIIERFGSFSTRTGLPLPAPEHEHLLAPSIRLLQEATTGFAD